MLVLIVKLKREIGGGRWERGEYGKKGERGNLLICKINKKVI